MDQTEYDKFYYFTKTGDLPKEISQLSESGQYRFKKHAKEFSLKNGVLLHQGKIVIRKDQMKDFLTKVYIDPSTGLIGMNKLYEKISSLSYGITQDDVIDFLRNLEVHQLHMPVIGKKKVVKPIIPSDKDHRWEIDLIDMTKYKHPNNGYSWILTMVDLFTKFGWAIPLKNKEKATVVRGMSNFLSTYKGHIKVIQSDSGSEFLSLPFKKLMEDHGIKQVFSQPYRPQTNGGVERYNKTLKYMIFKHMSLYKTQIWVDSLPGIVENYNTSYQSTIKTTPMQAVNASPKEKTVIHQNIIDRSVKVVENKKLNLPELPIGTTVRISNLTKKSVRKLKW